MKAALVEIVAVHMDQAEPVVAAMHDMGVPDFLEESAGHGAGTLLPAGVFRKGAA
jgi:hypothetical protein